MEAHRIAYAALSAIHVVIAVVLVTDGARMEAVCVFAAAEVYAALAAAGGSRKDAEKAE